jgi:REP-associated tyrosine transposase
MSPASHIFHEIFLHINWHCHEDRPLISGKMEGSLHQLIEEYCRKYRGVYFNGLGGTSTHVHLLVQVEPTVCPSDFIGKVKGFSSHEMNKRTGTRDLKWQKGYGVVSFARKNLPALLGYVESQKEHHQTGTVRETLEKWSVDVEEGVYRPAR